MSSINPEKLRGWWWHRQGLDGSLAGAKPAAVLAQSGWARSVGGVGPYLTLFSRAATSRAATDAAVAKLEIHELPSARGCTYVLPAADFGLGLMAGSDFGGAALKAALNLGVTEKEIARLCEAVLKALDKGQKDPEEIRAATGKASRSLGEAGKKKGLTTTLPIALGRLQASGDIRRVATNGRLDQQRYRYACWKPNPLAKQKLSPEEARTELARRFFRWIGPVTMAEFQWFTAQGVKACQAAVEPLGLVPAGKGSERLLLPDFREAFEAFKPGRSPQYALVANTDAMFLHRREIQSLIDPGDRVRKILGGISDLPSHAILDRGRLVGLWEYDTESASIAWMAWVAGANDPALATAVQRTETYVRNQLGDARSFSLDSPKSRAPRIQALRKQGGR